MDQHNSVIVNAFYFVERLFILIFLYRSPSEISIRKNEKNKALQLQMYSDKIIPDTEKEKAYKNNEQNKICETDENRFKEMVKKLFAARIKTRKILIANFEKYKFLNSKYPLVPWAKEYTLDQEKQAETIMRKDIKFFGDNDLKIENLEDLEIQHTNLEQEENLLQLIKKSNTGKEQNVQSLLREFYSNIFYSK